MSFSDWCSTAEEWGCRLSRAVDQRSEQLMLLDCFFGKLPQNDAHLLPFAIFRPLFVTFSAWCSRAIGLISSQKGLKKRKKVCFLVHFRTDAGLEWPPIFIGNTSRGTRAPPRGRNRSSAPKLRAPRTLAGWLSRRTKWRHMTSWLARVTADHS